MGKPTPTQMIEAG